MASKANGGGRGRRRRRDEEPPVHNRENPAPETAEAFLADRAHGELAEQREAVGPQERLGFPAQRGPRTPGRGR